jgi:AraC-like DNA-binding protein
VRANTAEEWERLRDLAGAVIARGGYRRQITLAALASCLSVSPRTLQRAYAREGRTTFSEELREVRLRNAAILLAEQPVAVADVARLVGYRSAPAFAAAFTRRYGVAPAAFRAEARSARSPNARGPPLTRRPRAATGRGW